MPHTVCLGIDFGTSNTVAVLRRDDGSASPLLFDGSPLLPSAVFAEGEELLTGTDAVHSARLDPARFEPHPKRRVDDGSVLLGDNEIAVTALFGAVLGQIRAECVRVLGNVPAATIITHPAAWGQARKQILTDAAAGAGFANPALVAEPVAAATHFVASDGALVHDGSAVVVFDLGAGTFDASVVSRTGQGFEVLAVDGTSELGGVDVDHALVEHLGRRFGDDPNWTTMLRPATMAQRRHRRALYEDVRIAKERLSRMSQVDIPVPVLDVDAHLTREELETITRPLMEEAVRITQAVIRAADTNIAGVFLVGGASRMPLAATMLHHATGIAPTILDQPELTVALGATASAASSRHNSTAAPIREQPAAAGTSGSSDTANAIPPTLVQPAAGTSDPSDTANAMPPTRVEPAAAGTSGPSDTAQRTPAAPVQPAASNTPAPSDTSHRTPPTRQDPELVLPATVVSSRVSRLLDSIQHTARAGLESPENFYISDKVLGALADIGPDRARRFAQSLPAERALTMLKLAAVLAKTAPAMAEELIGEAEATNYALNGRVVDRLPGLAFLADVYAAATGKLFASAFTGEHPWLVGSDDWAALVKVARGIAEKQPERADRLRAEVVRLFDSVPYVIDGEGSEFEALFIPVVRLDPEHAYRSLQTISDGDFDGYLLLELAQAYAGSDRDRAVALLVRAENHFLAKPDKDKGFGLQDVVPAWAELDPGRAEHLLGEFREEKYSKQFTLTTLAKRLASRDIERAELLTGFIPTDDADGIKAIAEGVLTVDAARAERIINAIPRDAQRAGWARRDAAEFFAPVDVRAAERIALSISDRSAARDEAIRHVVAAIAATDPARAERLARQISADDEERVFALAEVAESLAESAPERAHRLLIEAEGLTVDLAGSATDEVEALVAVARGLLRFSPERAARLLRRAEQVARERLTEYDASLSAALQEIACTWATIDTDRAERIAREIDSEYLSRRLETLASIARDVHNPPTVIKVRKPAPLPEPAKRSEPAAVTKPDRHKASHREWVGLAILFAVIAVICFVGVMTDRS